MGKKDIKRNGYTLLEGLVSVAILVLVMGMTFVGLTGAKEKSAVKTAAQQFANDLRDGAQSTRSNTKGTQCETKANDIINTASDNTDTIGTLLSRCAQSHFITSYYNSVLERTGYGFYRELYYNTASGYKHAGYHDFKWSKLPAGTRFSNSDRSYLSGTPYVYIWFYNIFPLVYANSAFYNSASAFTTTAGDVVIESASNPNIKIHVCVRDNGLVEVKDGAC